MRVDAALTRTGVLEYRQPDGGVIREYRPAEEVFKADSLATLEAAPVTKLHPPEMVTRANWSKYARGTVGENPHQDGDHVAARVYLQDADLADAVERGDMKEVSCGYHCDLVVQPGTTPQGERYDRMQTNIRYNHVAVVPVGRAGSTVALRLDSDDNVVTEERKDSSMHKERIDGVDYEVGTDAHRAAVERRDERVKAEKADRASLQARCDKAEGDLQKLQAKYDSEHGELEAVRKDAASKARAGLEASARKLLGESAKFDGKTDAQVRLDAVKHADPSAKLDGKGELYIEALFDIAVAKADSAREALGAVNAVTSPLPVSGETRADALDVDAARAEMITRNQNAWKGKGK